MPNPLTDSIIPLGNPMVADTPAQYANPTPAPQQGNWLVDALGRDFNRLVGSVANGFMAPANALTGQYSGVEVDPRTGQVIPFNSGLMQGAADLAGLVTVGGAGQVPADALGMGIRAYHGTPHSFDKFDIGKIGTGEGAQAYGHGLYFAESPGVAKSYAEGVTGITGPKNVAAKTWASTGDESYVRSQTKNIYPNISASELDDAVKYAKERKGNLYEVDINAEPHDFLDWDKPLSEQPKAVQDVLKPLADEAVKQGFATGYDTAGEAYNAARGLFPNGNDSAEIASRLRGAGVPGIKYLDAGSRGKGDGSRNYVVFHHDPVTITGKLPAAGAAPAAPVTHQPTSEDHPTLMELRA